MGIKNGKCLQKKKNEQIPKNRIDFYLGDAVFTAYTMGNILVNG